MIRGVSGSLAFPFAVVGLSAIVAAIVVGTMGDFRWKQAVTASIATLAVASIAAGIAFTFYVAHEKEPFSAAAQDRGEMRDRLERSAREARERSML